MMSILAGCLGPVTDLYPDNIDERPIPVYVVSHGWHVGIAIEKVYIAHLLPNHPEMPNSKILKFGWGDNKYYPESDAGFGLMLRAGLLPTRSVIHVVGIDIPIERYFSASRVVQIQISEKGAEKLGEFIADRFQLNNEGMAQIAAEGLYTNSIFFKANGLYFLPKTSNTWTARALRKTGYPITPFYSLTSGNVIKQAREEGRMISDLANACKR
ncbi:MAG: DUF2459 domain-containing protein [Balneolaceae bacterium]